MVILGHGSTIAVCRSRWFHRGHPGYRGSRPHIAGSGVTVDRIAVLHTVDAIGPPEIASDLGLSLGQVHAALAFFHLNRELFEEWLGNLSAWRLDKR